MLAGDDARAQAARARRLRRQRAADAGGRLTSMVWGANVQAETRSYATADHQVATIAVPGVTGFTYA